MVEKTKPIWAGKRRPRSCQPEVQGPLYKQSQFAPGPAGRGWATRVAKAPAAGASVRNKANLRAASRRGGGVGRGDATVPASLEKIMRNKPNFHHACGGDIPSFHYSIIPVFQSRPIVRNKAKRQLPVVSSRLSVGGSIVRNKANLPQMGRNGHGPARPGGPIMQNKETVA